VNKYSEYIKQSLSVNHHQIIHVMQITRFGSDFPLRNFSFNSFTSLSELHVHNTHSQQRHVKQYLLHGCSESLMLHELVVAYKDVTQALGRCLAHSNLLHSLPPHSVSTNIIIINSSSELKTNHNILDSFSYELT